MNAIAVVDENWCIGKNGQLLVFLPGDLAYFKKRTLGKTLILGRKTLESLPGGKPLPDRETVVLTKNTKLKIPGCVVCNSKEQVIEQVTGKEVFVAGGEAIYRLFLEECDTFYITKIYDTFSGDRFFPNLDTAEDMKVVWQSPKQEEKELTYQFFKYKRI